MHLEERRREAGDSSERARRAPQVPALHQLRPHRAETHRGEVLFWIRGGG